MYNLLFNSFLFFDFFGAGQNYIEKEPGVIVGPITQFLGYILSWLYNFAIFMTSEGLNALGISIIFLTILTRILMLPLAFKQQESMFAMKKLDPEREKIQKKYANATDMEMKQKMNQEIQKLYSANGVNPLSGCLPVLIQLPIFIALSYLMRQTYLFINHLGSIYNQIADIILSLPGYIEGRTNDYFIAFNNNFVQPIMPNGLTIDLLSKDGINRVLSKLSPDKWNELVQMIPLEYAGQINTLLEQKNNIETFFTISLVENSGVMWPGILIPIVSGASTFLSAYLMIKKQPNLSNGNDSVQQMQKIMLYGMPVMMGVMTIGFPAGVGLYWITSNIFQVFQQFGLNKYYESEGVQKRLEAKRLKKISLKKNKSSN